MAFFRTTPALLRGNALEAALRSCGLRLGPRRRWVEPADIELTLVSLAADSMPSGYRSWGVLCAWLEQHSRRVNVPKLLRIVRLTASDELLLAWWAAIGHWLGRSDARWRALTRLSDARGLSPEGDDELTRLSIARHGHDPRFAGGPLAVHSRLLRSRPQDVDPPSSLLKRHPTYRQRVIQGPNYRADIWAQLEHDSSLSPSELARISASTYETARGVAIDYRLVSSVA